MGSLSVSVAPNDYKADIQSKSHNLKDFEIKKDNFYIRKESGVKENGRVDGDGMSDEMNKGKILNCAGVNREKRNIMNARKSCSPGFLEKSIYEIDDLISSVNGEADKEGDRILTSEYLGDTVEKGTSAELFEFEICKEGIVKVGTNVVVNNNEVDEPKVHLFCIVHTF